MTTQTPAATEVAPMDAAEAAELAYLQEQIVSAEPADEPGTQRGDSVQKPNADKAAVGVASLTTAGYTWVYDTQTGRPVRTNINMLPQQLQKKQPDGTRRFTTQDPGIRPVLGTIKCLLHATDPNRKAYTAMGLPVCRKGNILSKMSLIDHMRHKHPAENRMIGQIATDAKDERAIQREEMTLTAMQRLAGAEPAPEPTPAPVAEAVAETEDPVAEPTPEPVVAEPVQVVAPCPVCTYKAKSTSKGGATMKLNTHKTKKHG